MTARKAEPVVDPRGPRFKAWREKLGLSQRQLAEYLPYSIWSILDFEQGHRRAPPYVIPEEAWERLKACCAVFETKQYMNDRFEITFLREKIGTRKPRGRRQLTANSKLIAQAARRTK